MNSKGCIDEVSKPTSSYIFKDENGVPMCLEGIEINIWNNGSFTTVFKCRVNS